MYILNVTATVPAEQMISVRPSHSEWVKEGFNKGFFLFAGPKVSEAGGFILAKAMPKDALEAFIAEDPYIIENVAKYTISEFNISLTAEGLDLLKA